MSNRVEATVLLLFGDQAEVTTAERGHDDPERVPVDQLVRETGIARDRLPGMDLIAVVGDHGELERFERA
ncbi:hypothetical protein [Streptomyces sp. NPDC101455]|uniref:hypothetical protein n=1 Tax=Streptomyces sp. NPDC101455 TaxID=3366142 RepID=UPI0037F24764